jgi:flagellar basal body-associated protein FliL
MEILWVVFIIAVVVLIVIRIWFPDLILWTESAELRNQYHKDKFIQDLVAQGVSEENARRYAAWLESHSPEEINRIFDNLIRKTNEELKTPEGRERLKQEWERDLQAEMEKAKAKTK